MVATSLRDGLSSGVPPRSVPEITAVAVYDASVRGDTAARTTRQTTKRRSRTAGADAIFDPPKESGGRGRVRFFKCKCREPKRFMSRRGTGGDTVCVPIRNGTLSRRIVFEKILRRPAGFSLRSRDCFEKFEMRQGEKTDGKRSKTIRERDFFKPAAYAW